VRQAIACLFASTLAVPSQGSDGGGLPVPILAPPTLGVPTAYTRPPVGAAFPLTVVAEIDTTFIGSRVGFADTDHDGMQEIIGVYRSSATLIWQTVFVERQLGGPYTASFPLGTTQFPVHASGDLDGDGKVEIVGQSAGGVAVYESENPWSFPSVLVWASGPLSNVLGYPTTGDSDGDGRMEIIHSVNSFSGTARLAIFESVGDNAFEQVLDVPTPGNASTGDKVILDMDRDGRLEIAFIGSHGWVHVFEAVADNQWQHIWMDSTGLVNAYAAEGGTDSDGNGRPELFVQGNDFSVFPPTTWPARVYESAADNEFHLVTTIPIPGSTGGITTDASGDLDGDGDREYIAVEVRAVWDPPPGGLWIYSAIGEGVWEAVAMIPNPGNTMGLPYTCDLNANGKSEIFWQSPDVARLYEYLPTSDAADARPAGSLVISPNPVRRSATIHYDRDGGVGAALLVYDVAGRLVERRDIRGQTLEWRPASLASGVYYFELRDARGRRIGADRALVLRSN